MHTDEAWLAGLSRAILETKSLSATESFFNLVHRAPHALKTFFHIIQIIFIKMFGFNLLSVRVFSVLCGAASLAVFAGILSRLKLNYLPGMILMSVEIQFIYASHFARQEIQVLLLMLISLCILLGGSSGKEFRRGLLSGLPIAIAVGFHPDAFIAAWPAGLYLLARIIRRKRRVIEGAGYLLAPAASAVFFIALSLFFNRSFISDYSSFGAETGVMEPFGQKLLGFDDFYRKLFLRISGTYYTPEIRPVFIAAAIAGAMLVILKIFRTRKNDAGTPDSPVLLAVAGITGVNAGIIIIGKYSAPSIVLIIPFLILLIAEAAGRVKRSAVSNLLYSAAAAILLVNSNLMVFEDKPYKNESYKDFVAELNSAIPSLSSGEAAVNHRVLGPLSAEFALEYGRLLDWRNLALLSDAGKSVEEYLSENNIEYIIYSEEIDQIYQARPVWNLLYGNPAVYYEQLRNFLNSSCEKVYEFASPGYGTRIVVRRFSRDWRESIFRTAD